MDLSVIVPAYNEQNQIKNTGGNVRRGTLLSGLQQVLVSQVHARFAGK